MPRLLFLFGFVLLIYACQFEVGPDFNTEVRPILNRNCLSCHGGVKKNGGISFLFREEAIVEGKSGKPCIVPGRPGQSELIARLTTDHPSKRMPLDGDPLSNEEIDVLRRWIATGAKWENPWSYSPIALLPPKVTAPAEVQQLKTSYPDWDSPIDEYLLSKIVEHGLQPKRPEEPYRLIRRLSLDLIGLPPKLTWIQAYQQNPTKATFSAIVDTLLASPHFGERWASPWLDLARYADTKGFERDGHRNIWLYRDWVINALNEGLPYDSFCIQQLAGDLLPRVDRNSLIATAFHRNTMTNDEGGTSNEEFRLQAVLDRVNTTWSVFLGTTMNCVQCHSHPYDPIRHKDYYTSVAVFNNDRDEDTYHDSPLLNHFPSPDSVQIIALRDFIDRLALDQQQREIALSRTNQILEQTPWQYHPHEFDSLDNASLSDVKWMRFRPGSTARLPNVDLRNKGVLFTLNGSSIVGAELVIRMGASNGPVLAHIRGGEAYHWQHQATILKDIPPLFQRTGVDLYFHYPVRQGVKEDMMLGWLSFLEPPFIGRPSALNEWSQSIAALYNSTSRETVPILRENEDSYARATRVFNRGSWLSQGDTVAPGLPAALQVPDQTSFYNRLGFAQWLTHPDNPLAARVAVNRYWAQLFGKGIVLTEEDFGSQGTPPTHPALLDYLAHTFTHEDHWSPKKFLRRLVLTGAYRQSARLDSLDHVNDPHNIWLARGPRSRLSAEQVRDQALAISGLLDPTPGGPSVMPPQPDGIWQVIYNGAQWTTNQADLHRRAIYTYWRRTSPYPSMETFDSPSREVCTVRRITTNTPLQALVTLNDPVYLEAARALALDIIKEYLSLPSSACIDALCQRVLFRSITAQELNQFAQIYESAKAVFQNDPSAATELLNLPDLPLDIPLSPDQIIEAAAFMTVANALLNLDEVLSK
ncbi:MAG: PSD1 and planctomycete cytochrome C domain-containing protein [Bacteroidota bacterium]